jgi:hypothetical protein
MTEQTDGGATAERRIQEAVRGGERSLSLAGLGLETLPSALSAMPTLRELDLSGNRLTELPAWIGDLTALESLRLSGNRLLTLPDALLHLESLARLDVADNQLIEIPEGLARLPLLERLELSGNRHLVSPPPTVVTQGSAAVLAHLRGPGNGREPERARGSALPPEPAMPVLATLPALPTLPVLPTLPGLATLPGESATQPQAAGRDPGSTTASPKPETTPEPPGTGARKEPRSRPAGSLPVHRLIAAGGAVVLIATAISLFAAGSGATSAPTAHKAAEPAAAAPFDPVFTAIIPSTTTAPPSTTAPRATARRRASVPARRAAPRARSSRIVPRAAGRTAQPAVAPRPAAKRVPAPAPAPAPAPTTTAVKIGGQVSCTSGRSVEGVWVQAAKGSGFAPWKGLGNGSTSDYWYTLPVSEPYSLHVGCGGTQANWGVALYSPTVGGTHNSFNCIDVAGRPGYGTCVKR